MIFQLTPKEELDEGEDTYTFDRSASIALVLNRAGRVRLPGVGGRRRRPCGGYPVDAIFACVVDSDAGSRPFHGHLPRAGQTVDSMGRLDSHPSRGGIVAAEVRVADGSEGSCSGDPRDP